MGGFKYLYILGIIVWLSLSYVPPCEYDTNLKWKIQNSRPLLNRDQITNTMFGIDLLVDSNDGGVSQEIKDRGCFSAKGARTLLRFVKKGDRVMNVGSHVAMESMVIGKIIGPTGRLYIFQPFSLSFGIAVKNVYLNELEDITTIFNVGCSNLQASGQIQVVDGNTGGSTILYDAENREVRQEVYLDKLDNLIDDSIDFMLMDVERFEVECLLGMKKIIKNSPNIIMYVEWGGISANHPYYKDKEKQILTWLKDEGFKFYSYNQKDDGTCDPAILEEKTVDEILNFDYSTFYGNLVDLTMARSHINIQALF